MTSRLLHFLLFNVSYIYIQRKIFRDIYISLTSFHLYVPIYRNYPEENSSDISIKCQRILIHGGQTLTGYCKLKTQQGLKLMEHPGYEIIKQKVVASSGIENGLGRIIQ